MNNYQLLRDAYFGSGGFASGAYLTKHKRESEEDYRFRRQNAYYLNYFAPIVNALVDPIFKHPCRFTIDVRLEGYTKATESRRILVATNFYKRRPDRHVYHTTSEALFAT